MLFTCKKRPKYACISHRVPPGCLYLQSAQLKVRLKTLLDKKVLQSRSHGISRRSAKFTTLQEGFQQFANDLNKLQQFVEVNGTAFSKILKKWDKTSKSKTKELYLSRAVEVQPFFNPTVISELSDQATTSLQELGAWAEGDNVNFEGRPDHILSSQHLLGTDEGDADTLLLDTVLSGNIDSLRDSLGRMRGAAESNGGVDISLMERVTRTFLTSVNQGPLEALQVLLETGLVDIQSEDDINERNCLHQAAIYGNSFVLQYALSKGVAVGRTDVYGRVPLHYASMHGRIDMLDALVGGELIDFFRQRAAVILTQGLQPTPKRSTSLIMTTLPLWSMPSLADIFSAFSGCWRRTHA